MSEPVAHIFIDALRALEEHRDLEALAVLYTEDAGVGNLLSPDRFHGPEGARQFWSEYRGTFQTLRSEFHNIIATADRAALEWTTQGTGFDGAPVRYSGVTILETAGGRVTRSMAYFDPGSLGRQVESRL